VLDDVLGGFKASAGEIGGAIMGAAGGATATQRMLPPMTPLPARATAGVIGAGIGGYTGATIGRATDLIRNAISLNKEIDAREVFEKSLEAGTADIAGTAAVGVVAKGVSKAVAPLGKAFDKARTLIKQGNLSGAKKQIMKDFDLTDIDIDKFYKNVAKDVEYAEDLTGDDLLRAKLTATMQQQPQGLEPLREAVKRNTKAAIETSKEIDRRAKEVMHSASRFAKKPSAIRKSVEKYEKAVQDNYGEVRSLIDEALPFHKSDLDTTSFKPTLDDLNKRVVDPTVKEKLTNLAESLASQKSDTVDDLIGIRQQYNKFYGKNIQHFDTKPDKEALKSIQDTIDAKIDEALDTLPENISKSLKSAFTDAKQKYVKMFKTQDTATYNAIFRKGASESDIANSLIKYSKAADKDLETVLSKLSPVQRTKAEFGVINKMVKDNLAKGEAKAISFTQLAEDIGTSKTLFKTPEAKQFIKNIEGFNTKFAKDIELQSAALGVTEKTKKNIATSVEGKARMVIASNYFEAFQRLFPSETGRRLSLQKAIEMSLEKSRSPREFFFKASKIKGIPNQDRIALKKAIKEIGEQEQVLKKKALIKKDKFIAQETQKKQKKILTEKEFHKAKWEKAKAERMKEVEAQKKGPSIEESKEQARLSKKPLSPQAQKVKDASVPEIGAEIDAEKKAVKNIFAKNTSEEARYKGMSKADIAEIDKQEAKALAEEANQVFVKGGDNLAVGVVAGIEKDEDGNITFDPAKFVAGLGGYTAVKALAKSKTIQKELKEYAVRAIDKLESKPGFNMLTGVQRVVPTDSKYLAKNRAARAASVKPKGKEIYNPETDTNFVIGNDGEVYFDSTRGWRKTEQWGIKQRLEKIDELGFDEMLRREDAVAAEMKATKQAEWDAAQKAKANGEYKDSHSAPSRDMDGATSIDNLTAIYPSDIYSANAARYYGHGDDKLDNQAIRILNKIKGNPNAKVKIYRTIPNDINADINEGDWVTITKRYAVEHGENRFDGKYKMLEKEVKASDIITDGNSIHEQGYDPLKINSLIKL